MLCRHVQVRGHMKVDRGVRVGRELALCGGVLRQNRRPKQSGTGYCKRRPAQILLQTQPAAFDCNAPRYRPGVIASTLARCGKSVV